MVMKRKRFRGNKCSHQPELSVTNQHDGNVIYEPYALAVDRWAVKKKRFHPGEFLADPGGEVWLGIPIDFGRPMASKYAQNKRSTTCLNNKVAQLRDYYRGVIVRGGSTQRIIIITASLAT